MQGNLALTEDAFTHCAKKLHAPQPRVTLGLALRDIANSAIDISDGLLADLGHILSQSNLGASIYLANIPHSEYLNIQLTADLYHQKLSMLLAGGDDYELCFTAPTEKHAEIIHLSESLKLPLSCIGLTTNNAKLVVHGFDDEILDVKEAGFDHFR
jgi:thiamine-monophosphate kinase